MSRLVWFARSVLVFVLGVILLGAYVRASGSGAGCGAHWPMCNGEVIPHAPGVKTMVEYSHRVTSGLSMLVVFALYFLSIRAKSPARHYAGWASLFMITEAALGAGIVLLRYVEDNASWARAAWTGLHLANTFLLLGALTLAWQACERPSNAPTGRWRTSDFVGLALLLLVAAVGAVTALGDTIFPAESLRAGFAADFSHDSHFLVRLRIVHPLLAIAVAAFWWFHTVAPIGEAPLDPSGKAVRAALALQVLIGVLAIALLAPIPMQLLHLLIADVLWMSAVVFAHRKRV